MFLDNHYTEEYNRIVDAMKGKERTGYMEKHHIIPRSLGGSNAKDNLVWLTAGDHFRCHQLLVHMTEDHNKAKMSTALWRMMHKQNKNMDRGYTFTPDEYATARAAHAVNHSKRMTGDKNFFYGKTHTAETREVMSAAKKGKTYEEIYGVEQAEAMRARRRAGTLGQKRGPMPVVTCPHCKKQGGAGIMARWHFDRCTEYNTDVEVV